MSILHRIFLFISGLLVPGSDIQGTIPAELRRSAGPQLIIWLVTIGEPVPTVTQSGERLHRSGALAHFLAERGHHVTWWTSTFDHFSKSHRFEQDTILIPNHGLRICLMKGPGYKSNLSMARVHDHQVLARKFALAAEAEHQRPDILLAAYPTIELCLAAVNYGKKIGVPVVLDIRDMWPDIFVDHAPALLRPVAKLVLAPMFREAHRACRDATAIVGITDAFLDFGLRHARRARSRLDTIIPFGYRSQPPPTERLQEADQYWDVLGVPRQPQGILAVCFSTISRQGDFETVVEAASRLNASGSPVSFIICGTGDRLDYYRQKAAGLQNINFPGWADAARIYTLMRRASVGIDPLPDRYDFLATINNKAIEYMSAGLPVISSPNRGMLCDLLRDNKCGLSYATGDAEGLAAALVRLNDDRPGLAEMSKNAARLFEQTFQAERVYGAMLAYLGEVHRDYFARRAAANSVAN